MAGHHPKKRYSLRLGTGKGHKLDICKVCFGAVILDDFSRDGTWIHHATGSPDGGFNPETGDHTHAAEPGG
jgi:hypothetical protein